MNVSEVLNGIFYVLWTGSEWKALPKDLPPKSTVHDYLGLSNWDGTLERIHHELYVADRQEEGREPQTMAIINSETAKGAQKGGLGSILRATTRQEDQGSQAVHPGRHAGPVVERHRSSGRCSGPRRCFSLAASGATTVPVHRTYFC